jgi:hypothetical protein
MRAGIIPIFAGHQHPLAWEIIIGITLLIVVTALVLWIFYEIKYRSGK